MKFVTTVNSLLSSNRWANREDQSEARTIPEGLHQSQIGAVARLVGNYKICI